MIDIILTNANMFCCPRIIHIYWVGILNIRRRPWGEEGVNQVTAQLYLKQSIATRIDQWMSPKTDCAINLLPD